MADVSRVRGQAHPGEGADRRGEPSSASASRRSGPRGRSSGTISAGALEHRQPAAGEPLQRRPLLELARDRFEPGSWSACTVWVSESTLGSSLRARLVGEVSSSKGRHRRSTRTARGRTGSGRRGCRRLPGGAGRPAAGLRELVDGPALAGARGVVLHLVEPHQARVVEDHRRLDVVRQALEPVVVGERRQAAAGVVVAEVEAAVVEELVHGLDEIVLATRKSGDGARRGTRRARAAPALIAAIIATSSGQDSTFTVTFRAAET